MLFGWVIASEGILSVRCDGRNSLYQLFYGTLSEAAAKQQNGDDKCTFTKNFYAFKFQAAIPRMWLHPHRRLFLDLQI